jgi:hypothetical protein
MEFGKLKKASKRTVKEEKYDYPVMTIHTKPEKGLANKVSFNKAAIKEFGFEKGGNLAFAFDGDDLFCKLGEKAYVIAKTNGTISDKTLTEALWEHFDTDGSEEIELAIFEESNPVYRFERVENLDPSDAITEEDFTASEEYRDIEDSTYGDQEPISEYERATTY